MIKRILSVAVLQLCNSFAVNILLVMLTAMIYRNRGSISVLMMLMTVPALLFSHIFGKLIDQRYSKRILLLLTVISLIFAAVLLCNKLYRYNWILYGMAFTVYSADYFIRLYIPASVTTLTGYQHYLKFNSAMNFIENVGIIVGPVLGGIFMQNNYLFTGFLLIEILFLCVFLASVMLKESESYAKSDNNDSDSSGKQEEKKKLRNIYFMAGLFSFVIGMVNVRQISFVMMHYDVAELGYRLTESLWGLGMIIGCFTIILLDKKWEAKQFIAGNYFLLGICMVLLVINRSYPLALIFFLILGIGNITISIGFTTLLQKMCDNKSVGKSLGMKNLWQQLAILVSTGAAGIFESAVSSDYLYFFENVAHTDNKEWGCCYCLNYCSDRNAEIEGFDEFDAYQRREYAIRYIREEILQGYLAYEEGQVIGWCNVNNRADCLYCFGFQNHVAGNAKISEDSHKIKSIFCFTVAPAMRGKGVATALLERMIQDALEEGYEYLEAYPNKGESDAYYNYVGPMGLYCKYSFERWGETEYRVIYEKTVKTGSDFLISRNIQNNGRLTHIFFHMC